MNFASRYRRRSAVALALAVSSVSASAAWADRSWNNVFSSTWNTASNWSPSGVPTASDNVFIQTGPGIAGTGGAVITYNGTYDSDLAVFVDNVDTQPPLTGFTTLRHSSGFNFDARYLYIGQRANSVGVDEGNGGNVSLRTGLFLGDDPTSKGTYDISSGSLRVRGNGGGQKGLYVGYGGTGTFAQSGTATVSTGAADCPLVLANDSGSLGTYNMNGGTATFDGDAFIGGSPTAPGGEGWLVINNGNASMSVAGKLKIWNTSLSLVQLMNGSLTVGALEEVGAATRFDWTGGDLTIGSDNSNSTFVHHSGTGGALTKVGSGTLDVTGVHAFTDGTAINGGTVRINNVNSLGTGAVAITSGATLSLNNTSFGNIINAAAGSFLTANGTASATGHLGLPATGTVVIQHTGGGVLTLGDAASDVGDSNDSSLIDVNGSSASDIVALPFANVFTGSWSISSGTLRIQNATSLGNGSSAVSINGGTLEVQNAALNRAVALNNGGTLKGSGAAASSLGTLTVASAAQVGLATGASASDLLTIGNAANDLTGGGAGSTITVRGSGIVDLVQNSNYVGNWNLESGSLRTAVDTYLGAAANTVTLTGGTLDVNGNIFTSRSVGIGSAGGTVRTSGSATFTINSPLVGNVGLLTLAGTGTHVLTAASTRTGPSFISLVTVKLSNGSALGVGSVGMNGGGTLELTGVTCAQPMTFGNSSILRGTGTSLLSGIITCDPSDGLYLQTSGSTPTLTIGDAPNDYTGGNLSTTFVSGPGTVALPFSNNYAGGWQLDSGTLRVGNATSLGSGASAAVINSASLEIVGGVTLGRALALNNGALVRAVGIAGVGGINTIAPAAIVTFEAPNAADVLTLGDSANELTGGSAASIISVAGFGTTEALQSSNYIGTWVLNGTLRNSGDSSLGNSSNVVTFNGGKLLTAVAMTSARNLAVNPAGGTIDTNGLDSTISGAITGFGTLTKASAGSLSVTNVRTGGLSVAGGTLRIIPTGGASAGTSKVTSLAIAAKLDLTDNKLIVKTTPIGLLVGSSYTDLTGRIQSGRGDGATPYWDGASGIVTSQSTATAGNLHSIGIAKASQVRPATATATDLWGGQTITGTDTLIMYTYGGDATLDGKINIDDYVRIDQGSAGGLTGWFNGDFNYDGKVTIDDYITIIDVNIGNQNGSFPTGGGIEGGGMSGVTAVPEPAGFGAILILAGAGAGARLRRRLRCSPSPRPIP